MEHQKILLTKEDSVATVTLNRPERMNSFDFPTLRELLSSLEQIAADPEVRAVVLTGSGRAFCAGADLNVMRESSDPASVVLKGLTALFHPIISTLRRMDKPVIAAVNGFASGGGFSLAVACDIVIAAEGARFNAAYVNIGLSPDGSLTYLLPRLVGLQRAAQLFFTGEQVDAEKGYELGFVNQVVKAEELMDVVGTLAKRLAAGPTFAIARAKQLLNRSFHESLETQMENERGGVAACGATEDLREGVTAFLEKRPPQYKGR